jgi:hypothetical protein
LDARLDLCAKELQHMCQGVEDVTRSRLPSGYMAVRGARLGRGGTGGAAVSLRERLLLSQTCTRLSMVLPLSRYSTSVDTNVHAKWIAGATLDRNIRVCSIRTLHSCREQDQAPSRHRAAILCSGIRITRDRGPRMPTENAHSIPLTLGYDQSPRGRFEQAQDLEPTQSAT